MDTKVLELISQTCFAIEFLLWNSCICLSVSQKPYRKWTIAFHSNSDYFTQKKNCSTNSNAFLVIYFRTSASLDHSSFGVDSCFPLWWYLSTLINRNNVATNWIKLTKRDPISRCDHQKCPWKWKCMQLNVVFPSY